MAYRRISVNELISPKSSGRGGHPAARSGHLGRSPHPGGRSLATPQRLPSGGRPGSRDRDRGTPPRAAQLPSFGTFCEPLTRAPPHRTAPYPAPYPGAPARAGRPVSPGGDPGRTIRKRGSSSGKCKNLWSSEEDEVLIRLAGPAPENWNLISTSLRGRTGKQCRERWLNHLQPNIRKGSWTAAEDGIILREQALRGNCWSDIARMLPGRSDNAVKNRFNATLKRQKSGR